MCAVLVRAQSNKYNQNYWDHKPVHGVLLVIECMAILPRV